MNNYIVELTRKYSKLGILLDTNILLLYFVGKFEKKQIPQFKRTKTFSLEDYDILVNLLHNFSKVITLPNILTEVSNLSGQLSENLRENYFNIFATEIILLQEEYLPSATIARMTEFRKFGITDTAIFRLVKDKYLVLTDDFKLSQYLQKQSIDVINFNQIRFLN